MLAQGRCGTDILFIVDPKHAIRAILSTLPVEERSTILAALGSNDPMLKETWTVAEVQRFLGLSRTRFHELRKREDERFPAPFRSMGRDHWLKSDVLAWIESR